MRLTGTGKRRISLADRGLAARAVGSREPAPELAQVVAPERELDPAAELELVRVAVELEVVPVAVELEVVPVAVELEHGQAVAELELNRVEEQELVPAVEALVLVQVAVAPRTRSVIAVRHRGLAPVPKRVEDLAAAVAETTRAPAATEAATAWAAAV
jgi:hypothetical protein